MIAAAGSESDAQDDVTLDAFLGGRLALKQPRRGYRAATDPVILAAAAPARAGMRVLDVGCGVGTAALCLHTRVSGLKLHGIEREPVAAALSTANAARAGADWTLHHGDLAAPPPTLRALTFDLVITNPPYQAPDALASPNPARDAANREETPLAVWLDVCLKRLAPKGRLVLIHRAERLGEALAALQGRAGAVEILPLSPFDGADAGRIVVRARKDSRTPLRLLAARSVHAAARNAAGTRAFTATFAAILGREAAALDFSDEDADIAAKTCAAPRKDPAP